MICRALIMIACLASACSKPERAREVADDKREHTVASDHVKLSAAAMKRAEIHVAKLERRVLSTGAAYAANQLVQNHGHWVENKEFDDLQDDVRLNFDLDEHALSDGAQSLTYEKFGHMMRAVAGVAAAVERTISGVREPVAAR